MNRAGDSDMQPRMPAFVMCCVVCFRVLPQIVIRHIAGDHDTKPLRGHIVPRGEEHVGHGAQGGDFFIGLVVLLVGAMVEGGQNQHHDAEDKQP